MKINGADADFHRKDLWEAIDGGDFPEYELGFQIFDEATAERFEFDVLDATKLIPEEFVPLQMVGKMVLNRNPDNFFAETEQVAFCPSHLVPGLDFSEDPLLQGRLFSYLDTQITRLGGPNFHQLPVNAPKCPFHNLQRDGIHQMSLQKGRVAYEPNSLAPDAPRESLDRGFTTSERPMEGGPIRARSESFSDHYSQARLFFRSITPPEQKHLANALTFELGKVETEAIRLRMLGHLLLIDKDLANTVIGALGAEGKADKITPAKAPIDLKPSPALRLYGKFPPTLEGRKVGVLLGAGFDAEIKKDLVAQIESEKAKAAIVTCKIQGEVCLLYTSALLAGILFGLAPALKISGTNVHDSLKEGGRGASGARKGAHGVLVVVEIALALVLLIGAGLTLRSLEQLWNCLLYTSRCV